MTLLNAYDHSRLSTGLNYILKSFLTVYFTSNQNQFDDSGLAEGKITDGLSQIMWEPVSTVLKGAMREAYGAMFQL